MPRLAIYTFIILLLTTLNACKKVTKKKNKKTVSVKITLDNCIESKYGFHSLDSILLFRWNEFDLSFQRIKPPGVSGNTLYDLEYGLYKAQYSTLFIEKVSEEFIINSSDSKEILLCHDDFKIQFKYPNSFIGKLRYNEELVVKTKSQGCFHSVNGGFSIKRDSNGFYHYKDKRNSFKMTQEQVESFKKAEIELRYLSASNCTTTETFEFQYRDQTSQYINGTCQWNGFAFLYK